MVDSLIILYGPDELYKNENERFKSLGIGVLTDTISCTVTEQLNGEYYLDMEYPFNGYLSEQIVTNNLIAVNANKTNQNKQVFRIFSIDFSMGDSIKIKANHISYDLNNYIIRPTENGLYAQDIPKIVMSMRRHLFGNNYDYLNKTGDDNPNSSYIVPFKLYFGGPDQKEYIDNLPLSSLQLLDNLNQSTERTNLIKDLDAHGCNVSSWQTLEYHNPLSVKQLMFSGDSCSLLNIFDTDYKYDNCDIYFMKSRSKRINSLVRYGYNMSSLSYTVDFSNKYTHAMCYLARNESNSSTNTNDYYVLYSPIHPTANWIPAIPNYVNLLCINAEEICEYSGVKLDNYKIADMKDSIKSKKIIDELNTTIYKYLNKNDGKNAKALVNTNMSVTASWSDLYNYNNGLSNNDVVKEFETVEVGDTVKLYNSDLMLYSDARIASLTYDVISKEYTEVTFNSIYSGLANSLSDYKQKIKKLERDNYTFRSI